MIYTRISSDSEGRELGVTRQLEDCTALAERHGWTIVREYRDNDRGASTRSRKARPEYAAMLAAVAAGRIKTVVSGDVDVNTADGRMMLQIMASIDQGEAERTAERIARAHRQRRDEGRPNWTRRPFGHELDGTEREPGAAAIRQAAALVIEEHATLYAIMRNWNADGMTAVSGVAWSIDTLGRLLRSPRLAGLMPDGTPSPKIAEILTPDRWRAMVAVLDERGRAVAVKGGAGRLAANLMSGIAECYASGCTGRISVSRAGGRRRYICTAGHVSADVDTVDRAVADYVAAGRSSGKLGSGQYAAFVREAALDYEARSTVDAWAREDDAARERAEADRLAAEVAAAATPPAMGEPSTVKEPEPRPFDPAAVADWIMRR